MMKPIHLVCVIAWKTITQTALTQILTRPRLLLIQSHRMGIGPKPLILRATIVHSRLLFPSSMSAHK